MSAKWIWKFTLMAFLTILISFGEGQVTGSDGTVKAEAIPAAISSQPSGAGSIALSTLSMSIQPLDDTSLAADPTDIAVDIDGGESHTCAVTKSGAAYCWGSNEWGQAGIKFSIGLGFSEPQPVNGLFQAPVEITTGGNHSCAVTANGAKCWGQNNAGQLGDGSNQSSDKPVDVIGLSGGPVGVVAVAAGESHTCARFIGSSKVNLVKCWGSNIFGQLGDGTYVDSAFPVEVVGLSGVVAITAGKQHTCALLDTGGVKCWGKGDDGQLGNGDILHSGTPVNVSGLSNGVKAIAAGHNHNCALLESGSVKCWGANEYGQIGDGTSGIENEHTTPVAVKGLVVRTSAIALGGWHTCALTDRGSVLCWGRNTYGQLGDGEWGVLDTVPIGVESLPGCGVATIAAGESHTCAITNGGVIKCWGRNQHGQIGNGSNTGKLEAAPSSVVGFGDENSYFIGGHVFDKDMYQVNNVEVSNGTGITSFTDNSNSWGKSINRKYITGGFNFCGLKAGTYTITPYLPGYFFVPPKTIVTVPPDEVSGSLNFIASPIHSYKLSGHVTNADGKPIGGATVNTNIGVSAVTDANGDYSLGLGAGTYTITPTWDGHTFSPLSRNVVVDNNKIGQNFTATAPKPTTLASHSTGGVPGNGSSRSPSMSADGRFVAFESSATDLVEGDANLFCGPYGGVDCKDIFVYDRQTGEMDLVSVGSSGEQANYSSDNPKISADGRFVAFSSIASNLVEGDTNGFQDAFVHDRYTGQTLRVSVASDGTQGNGTSGKGLYYSNGGLSISGDGRYVAFGSHASNLVVNDTNGKADIFVHDLQTGETQRVSVASDGVESNDHSRGASISADARYVAFASSSIFLVRPDTNGMDDVFVHDLQTGETTLVSVAADGTQADGQSSSAEISGDGRYVAFYSDATNLLSNHLGRVYILDRQTGQITNVPHTSYSYSISANGRYVAFPSDYWKLVGDDTNNARDVFAYDLQTLLVSRVSVASDSTEGNADVVEESPAISADGLIVAFASAATNMAPGDTNEKWEIFVNQRSPITLIRVFLSLIRR